MLPKEGSRSGGMCLPRGTDAQARSRMTSSLATVGRPIRSLAAAILIALPGCGVAPSVNILGSFFPAWLICIVAGVVHSHAAGVRRDEDRARRWPRGIGLPVPCRCLDLRHMAPRLRRLR